MNNAIPDRVQMFFTEHSAAWRESLSNVATYDELAGRVENLSTKQARELLAVAVSYVSTALNEINIYQSALERLRRDEPERSVDSWLDALGFKVEHNQLGAALVNRIAVAFQNVIQVVQNFIRHIVAVLSMTLDEVSFTFSISPSVALKFK